MQTLQRQKGLSGIGWLFVLILIASGALVGLKLIPVYLGNMTIASVLDDMAQGGKSYGSTGAVEAVIVRRLNINDVDQAGLDDILVSRTGRIYNVTIDYEVRVPLVYNIDFLLTFENRAEVPAG